MLPEAMLPEAMLPEAMLPEAMSVVDPLQNGSR